MIRQGKSTVYFGLFLWLIVSFYNARAGTLPAIESVLQKGFPQQADELTKITEALFQEHQQHKNVVSLIFYSYGLLLQAKNFTAKHNYINAAEYSRMAFFYLDEAVESHEDNLRVRYLRARIDAWLPATSGRCVITLNDTVKLNGNLSGLTKTVAMRINLMRYRALLSCQKYTEAEQLLQRMSAKDAGIAPFTVGDDSPAPEWSMQEIGEIVMPLLRSD